jgi:hypothetical protein
MKRVLAAVLGVIALETLIAGCGDAKPLAAKSRIPEEGLLYQQLSPERWRIGWRGVGAFDAARVQHDVLRHAAKLTLSRSFDWFEPIGERPEPVEDKTAVDPQRPSDGREDAGLRLKWGEACASGWTFGPDPASLCKGEDRPPAAAYQATTQIIMGHGVPPRNGLALSARSVMKETRVKD